MTPVAFIFHKKGLITVNATAADSSASFDHLFELGLEGGAEDVKEVETDEGMEWEVKAVTLIHRASLTRVDPHPANRAFQIDRLDFLCTT